MAVSAGASGAWSPETMKERVAVVVVDAEVAAVEAVAGLEVAEVWALMLMMVEVVVVVVEVEGL